MLDIIKLVRAASLWLSEYHERRVSSYEIDAVENIKIMQIIWGKAEFFELKIDCGRFSSDLSPQSKTKVSEK